MVRTSRISTHDRNRGEIPFKDQILAMNHATMRRLVAPYIGTSQHDVDGMADTSVVIGAENLRTLAVENVLRAYMAKSSTGTSLYQAWLRGVEDFCGHPIPPNLVPNGKLPYVMDTPSTKAENDESVAAVELFKRCVCTPEQYTQLINSSLVAFGVVSHFLAERGLILVDTKTEHGVTQDGKIVSQDELYTMDSSRFWLAEDYANQLGQLERGEIEELKPRSFSKEFARGFSKGDEGYTDEQRALIAVRYIMGIQNLLGNTFEPSLVPRDQQVEAGLTKIVDELAA